MDGFGSIPRTGTRSRVGPRAPKSCDSRIWWTRRHPSRRGFAHRFPDHPRSRPDSGGSCGRQHGARGRWRHPTPVYGTSGRVAASPSRTAERGWPRRFASAVRRRGDPPPNDHGPWCPSGRDPSKIGVRIVGGPDDRLWGLPPSPPGSKELGAMVRPDGVADAARTRAPSPPRLRSPPGSPNVRNEPLGSSAGRPESPAP